MTKNKKDFFQKRVKENYFQNAKKINVRARSYFKLKQIDEKFKILKENTNILDLGCAPGGWLEYIDQKLQKAKIIGIDLLEVKKPREFSEKIQIIEDDFNNIEEYTLEPFDLILSDMAPEFSGDSKFDRGKTHKLNLSTLEFAQKHLKKEGNLVFKSFEGEDFQYVLKKARKFFEKISVLKPDSSQKKSAEVFVICLNKNS
ncbi:MAG: SAM-dependent methyltransferase [Nanoarchaeota archaeon]